MKHRLLALLAVAGIAGSLSAQDVHFNVDGRTVNVHGFVSEGFGYSNQNNYLTMKTTDGSPAFTDGALNVSSQITDKFRVGAQVYDRNIGQLGKWHPTLDWAFGDYKFKDWFGFRAGKVKTALGLYNDTQDMSFLHTWAILPQAMYSIDLRSRTIAHNGGDVYGDASLRKAGSLSYTAYAGTQSDDPYGGYDYSLADSGLPVQNFSTWVVGTDVRWMPRVEGLTIGESYMRTNSDISGHDASVFNFTFNTQSMPQYTTATYIDYVRGRLHLSTEYRRQIDSEHFSIPAAGYALVAKENSTGFFAAAAYRVSKKLEIGTYNSRYYLDQPATPESAANHIFDQTITARVDIKSYWNVKMEGHFIDGYGNPLLAHGFYLNVNPNGLKPTTNLLVLQTGFNF